MTVLVGIFGFIFGFLSGAKFMDWAIGKGAK